MPAVYGLIDGNSFYCSAERAFAPALRGRPVIVLSNNDGCAIARTAEAKALGIRMGDAWHLIRDRQGMDQVEWFSSNYALYGDMSRRVYQVLAERVPRVEPYSIDEFFLDLDMPGDLALRCWRLREDVLRITKIPTCIGWGPTKTIAKLANGVAKDRPKLQGLCDLRDPAARARLYEELEVGEVWGIGGQTTKKLVSMGVATIAQFVALGPELVRDMLTVVGARVQAELRGVSCLQLAQMAPTRKGIAVTRSFGRPVTTWPEMREAVAAYAARAAEKLRAEGLQAGHLTVFLHTNPHRPDEPWHSGQRGARIEATADTRDLIREAVRLLEPLWRDGCRYFKAGVMLNDLSAPEVQARLFATRSPEASRKVMAVLDAVNLVHGAGTLRPAATGMTRAWSTRAARRSPRYTTRIEDIMGATVL
ncbi:Y-family DNA polymerase [Pararoseomonas sp. SCSIO 73927]|uniref:Y-family DNA polymerase n=1 Tax=Pararoseomonas sp. SCSIO 73927 TaxID=3114537 RepID=UPI0030D4B799